MLPSNGTFEVRYDGGNAVLEWSKPAGDYTRQVIEQWTNKNRQRRETETVCEKNPGCTQHDLTKDQTSFTITVEHQEYTFILVLYDGDVPVSAYQAKEDPVSGKCSEVMDGFKLTEKLFLKAVIRFILNIDFFKMYFSI